MNHPFTPVPAPASLVRRLFRSCVALVLLLTASNEASAALVTASTVTGNVGATVAAYPTPSSPGAGTLTVGGIPAGSTILSATLYANNYFGAPATTATFDSNPLGPVGAFATDAGFNAYKFDVTSFVTGNGSYSANYAGPNNTYGLALAVVYSHPSLPYSTVTVADGAIDLTSGNIPVATFNTTAAGAGIVFLHTLADNDGESGEVINFNGNPIGGPIDANLGNFASLFSLPVTALNGANTLSINDPDDQFGVDLAVLVSPAPAPVVPEPATLAVFGALAAGAFGVRRRRKSVA